MNVVHLVATSEQDATAAKDLPMEDTPSVRARDGSPGDYVIDRPQETGDLNRAMQKLTSKMQGRNKRPRFDLGLQVAIVSVSIRRSLAI